MALSKVATCSTVLSFITINGFKYLTRNFPENWSILWNYKIDATQIILKENKLSVSADVNEGKTIKNILFSRTTVSAAIYY